MCSSICLTCCFCSSFSVCSCWCCFWPCLVSSCSSELRLVFSSWIWASKPVWWARFAASSSWATLSFSSDAYGQIKVTFCQSGLEETWVKPEVTLRELHIRIIIRSNSSCIHVPWGPDAGQKPQILCRRSQTEAYWGFPDFAPKSSAALLSGSFQRSTPGRALPPGPSAYFPPLPEDESHTDTRINLHIHRQSLHHKLVENAVAISPFKRLGTVVRYVFFPFHCKVHTAYILAANKAIIVLQVFCKTVKKKIQSDSYLFK